MGRDSARLQMVTYRNTGSHVSWEPGSRRPHTSTPILALTPPPGEEHRLRTEAACRAPASSEDSVEGAGVRAALQTCLWSGLKVGITRAKAHGQCGPDVRRALLLQTYTLAQHEKSTGKPH